MNEYSKQKRKILMLNILFEFPRELAFPGRRLVSEQQFYSLINKYNGIKDLWASIYQPEDSHGDLCCTQKSAIGIHYCAAKIRLLWLDSDNDKSFEVLKKLCSWADENGLMHLPVFSGEHYHFYLFLKGFECLPIDEIRKRQILAAAQEHVAKCCGLSIGEPHSADIDRSIIGNIKQTVRVLNTVNIASGLFCIPLTHEDIQLGEQHIKHKAQHQQLDFVLYGNQLFDISVFKESRNHANIRPYSDISKFDRINQESKASIQADKVLSELASVCESIPSLLLGKYVAYHARYHVIIALKELDFSIDEANAILEKHLAGKKHPHKGKDNYYSCVLEEKQLQRLYARDDLFFSHKKMIEDGLCHEKCRGRGVYL